MDSRRNASPPHFCFISSLELYSNCSVSVGLTVRHAHSYHTYVNSFDNIESLGNRDEPASLSGIRDLFRAELGGDTDFTPLEGFKLNLSATTDFHKLFFATHCSCKTAGLLSIEVARSKTIDQIKHAMPQLVERLRAQARAFRAMPCEMHTRMRMGGRLPAQAS